jgi:uncharacterized protein YcbK (DUF882 family)
MASGPSLAFLTVVTLTPVVILIGMRISAAATLGPIADAWAPTSGLAASVAVHSLGATPFQLEQDPSSGGAPVTIWNENTKETQSFVLPFDGVLSQADLMRITHLFRCKRTGHELAPARGLIQLLARVGEHYPGHVIELVSGHRHNRGTSRTSKHWSAHAADIRIRGVDVKDVRAFVWKMDAPVGLGYYREQQFVHMDYRPIEGKIAWDQRREGGAYHYHPAWAGGDPKKQRLSREKTLRSARPQI